MVSKYFEIIDDKKIPTWALKPVDELSRHDIKARARWVLICDMAKKVFRNPDEWEEILKEFDKVFTVFFTNSKCTIELVDIREERKILYFRHYFLIFGNKGKAS